MAVYEGRGYELYAPCNKRSFGATWPVSWGPLVLFPVGDFLRIPSLKELWEWDKAVNTQNNLHMKNLDHLSSNGVVSRWSASRQDKLWNLSVNLLSIQLQPIQWILFNTYSGRNRGVSRLFWSFKKCIVDRILVSAQEPKEEKCHKLWAASILVYIHLTSSIQYTWHINYSDGTFNMATLNCFCGITAWPDSVLWIQVITNITLKYLLFNEYRRHTTMYIPYPNMYVQCTRMKYSTICTHVQPTIGYKYELLQWAQCGASFSTIEMGSVTL